jgi:tetratricopeptide (TPR) repeat protein
MRFAHPGQSWAVLIGTASYAHPEMLALPAVANNLTAIRDVLIDPGLGGLLPEHCVTVTDPSGLPALGIELARVAERAEDTLIVYYAGHGVLDTSGALFLALPDTHPDHVAYTALPLPLVRRAIADSPARSRILILDCCFSGRAIEAMANPSALISGQIEITGAYTLTSAPANEPARAPAGARHTAFTAELLNVLRHGLDSGSEGLSLEEIYLELKRAHLARGLPPPQQLNTSTIGHLALVRNAAYRHDAPASPAPTAARPIPTPTPAPSAGPAPQVQADARVAAAWPVPEPSWAAGLTAWRAGDLDEASRLIRLAAESAADDRALSAADIVLGVIHRDGYRDLDAAEGFFIAATKCDDHRISTLGHLHYGCVLELRGDTQAAETQYQQLIGTAEPDCAAFAAGRLGWLLIDRGRNEEAEQAFRAGYDLDDSPARVWPTLALANVLLRSGRPDEAGDRYEETLASANDHAKAFAALGLRQLSMENGLMAQAAEFAHSIAENPAAIALWPVVLGDEAPATPEGRIYAMSKWLTWLRSGHGDAVCFSDTANPRQFIVFENGETVTMSVWIAPRALPRKLRGWYSKDVVPQLKVMGFEAENREGNSSANETESWVMDVSGRTDQNLSTLSDEIMTEMLTGRSNFALKVESEPASTNHYQPRTPMPDLLPDQAEKPDKSVDKSVKAT